MPQIESCIIPWYPNIRMSTHARPFGIKIGNWTWTLGDFGGSLEVRVLKSLEEPTVDL